MIQYDINHLVILLIIKHIGVMAAVAHAKEEHHDHTMMGVGVEVVDAEFLLLHQ
jgi:hypothetical protein